MIFDRIKLQGLRVAAWCSQGINCLFLGGHHDQTLSARCYVNRNKLGWLVAHHTIDRVFKILLNQSNHCYHSHLRDLEFSRETLSNE